MNTEKYNINMSIDEKSIQICIDGKFYYIVNSPSTKDEFQMVGLQIMDMIDALDDILKFREIRSKTLDETMKKKMSAFSMLLRNSLVSQKTDLCQERFVKSKVGQQTFQAISMRQNDIASKNISRTLSVCEKEIDKRKNIENKTVDVNDDETLCKMFNQLYGQKAASIEVKPEKIEEKKTIAKKVLETQQSEIDKNDFSSISKKQQELIDLYISCFGKIKVPRTEYLEKIKSRRFEKWFGGYTNFVNAVLS